MRTIDLTHTFGPVMPSYPGDPVPSLTPIADAHAGASGDHLLRITMHIGTHMDAPLHIIPGGKPLSDISVETFVGHGILLDARGQAEISDTLLDAVPEPGCIVLVMTGQAHKWGTDEYYREYPLLSPAFATRALELGVKMLGMDTPSPDASPFAAHKTLLGRDVPIVENLTNLESLIDIQHFTVMALPMKLEADAGPVRVMAMLQDHFVAFRGSSAEFT